MPTPEIYAQHRNIMQWLAQRGLPTTTDNLNRAQLALLQNPGLEIPQAGGVNPATAGAMTGSGTAPSMDDVISRSMEDVPRTGGRMSTPSSSVTADDLPEERTSYSNQRGGAGSAAASGVRSPNSVVDAIDGSANSGSAVKQVSGDDPSSAIDWLDPLAAGAAAAGGYYIGNRLINPAAQATNLPTVRTPSAGEPIPFIGGQGALPNNANPASGLILPPPQASIPSPFEAMAASAAPSQTVMPPNATIQAIMANRARGGALPAPAARPPIVMPNPMATPNVIPLPSGPVASGATMMTPQTGQAATAPQEMSGDVQKPRARRTAGRNKSEENEPTKEALKKRSRVRAGSRAIR